MEIMSPESFHHRALASQPETDTKGWYEDGSQAVIPAGSRDTEIEQLRPLSVSMLWAAGDKIPVDSGFIPCYSKYELQSSSRTPWVPIRNP